MTLRSVAGGKLSGEGKAGDCPGSHLPWICPFLFCHGPILAPWGIFYPTCQQCTALISRICEQIDAVFVITSNLDAETCGFFYVSAIFNRITAGHMRHTPPVHMSRLLLHPANRTISAPLHASIFAAYARDIHHNYWRSSQMRLRP